MRYVWVRVLSPLCVVAAALVAAACASAPRNSALDKYPANVTGRTRVIYYDVHGRTYEELWSDMRRTGSKVLGVNYVGETRSPMRWRWQLESTGTGQCTIRDVSVSVDAEITLPRWNPPGDADSTLVAEWKRFLSALEMHEAGHKDISAKAAHDIITQLRGMTGLCSAINMNANDIARTIVDNATVEQQAYDTQTRHGATQGTTFSRPARR